ncbi:DUF2200 family protein [Arenivirga flava]|uniref:Uncharacterized protein n=1 Tax=Arenivirga flava TaxID=1930060 RepID=A0AA37XBW4_9MICO|nr:DUF2200 family protein [Arenivirga flava]GMA27782.1 hypothetical protein GCM10025874_10350 [Arenivirga flava]
MSHRIVTTAVTAVHPLSVTKADRTGRTRVEELEPGTMREIRILDKLVDELAEGEAMEKILRT